MQTFKSILIYLRKFEQIQEIRIASNALIPINDHDLIDALKADKRIFLSLSNYQIRDIRPFLEAVKSWGLSYQCIEENTWYDFGDLKKRNRSHLELKAQFEHCDMLCRCVVDGRMYYCPRSGHGARLGRIPCSEDEYLDLFDDKNRPTKEIFAKAYYRKTPVTACDFCDQGMENVKIVPAGKDQLRRGEHD